MSQICKVLQWMCAFILCSAIAQLITLLPWSQVIIGISAVVIYSYGQQQNLIVLQVASVGLVFGWFKCFFGG
ncbi:hypothetical protein LC605_15040 [Nostoc sp. CHAB 5836]|uniref:hypothetical protein n=1 Tax=Nostoc sp. CHAB 5836 TaxID=2780404 RepID=UPI001E5148FD|nr:hypothetical protein [Nostoc sp. CHAB 5836]MCC5616361.1 hypothetical protein [Nostoc sp. CHAB 5836]